MRDPPRAIENCNKPGKYVKFKSALFHRSTNGEGKLHHDRGHDVWTGPDAGHHGLHRHVHRGDDNQHHEPDLPPQGAAPEERPE